MYEKTEFTVQLEVNTDKNKMLQLFYKSISGRLILKEKHLNNRLYY
jgi:hypothetical protein